MQRRQLLGFTCVVILLVSISQAAAAEVIVYVGYLNNLSGRPNQADMPTPFDAEATTMLISSGGVDTFHDTGVIRLANRSGSPVIIDRGLRVTVRRHPPLPPTPLIFQIWDGFLPLVLPPGKNLVFAETVRSNFDTSDSGGIGALNLLQFVDDPVVTVHIDGTTFSFRDTARVLLGHEEANNTPETTPYQVLGKIEVPAVTGTLVRCVNGTTGQSVRLVGGSSIFSLLRCVHAGLAVQPGDHVRPVVVVGPAPPLAPTCTCMCVATDGTSEDEVIEDVHDQARCEQQNEQLCFFTHAHEVFAPPVSTRKMCVLD